APRRTAPLRRRRRAPRGQRGPLPPRRPERRDAPVRGPQLPRDVPRGQPRRARRPPAGHGGGCHAMSDRRHDLTDRTTPDDGVLAPGLARADDVAAPGDEGTAGLSSPEPRDPVRVLRAATATSADRVRHGFAVALRRTRPRRSDYAGLRRSWRHDLIAGITVAVVALPLALGFGVTSGVSAAAGLVTAIVAGFVAAVFGGSNLQVSGPTGAMAVVLVPIVARYGPESVATVAIMAGVVVVVAGWLGL